MSEPETIAVVVPPIAVSSAQIVHAPSFVVFPTKGTAAVRGTLVERPTEEVHLNLNLNVERPTEEVRT